MRDDDNSPLATPQPPPAAPASLIFHPGDWMPLRDAVLQFLAFIGAFSMEARKSDLKRFNQYLRSGLLEVVLMADDGTPTLLDWERRKVDAPLSNPAEGVRVDPYEVGIEHYFARRANFDRLISPSAPAAPADRQLHVAGESEPAARAEEPMPEPASTVELEPAPPSPQVDPEPSVNRGGRPTDRDLVLEEASWRLRREPVLKTLRREPVPKTLAAFARQLRKWLIDHGEHLTNGEVMKAETIEGHVRSLWHAYKRA